MFMKMKAKKLGSKTRNRLGAKATRMANARTEGTSFARTNSSPRSQSRPKVSLQTLMNKGSVRRGLKLSSKPKETGLSLLTKSALKAQRQSSSVANLSIANTPNFKSALNIDNKSAIQNMAPLSIGKPTLSIGKPALSIGKPALSIGRPAPNAIKLTIKKTGTLSALSAAGKFKKKITIKRKVGPSALPSNTPIKIPNLASLTSPSTPKILAKQALSTSGISFNSSPKMTLPSGIKLRAPGFNNSDAISTSAAGSFNNSKTESKIKNPLSRPVTPSTATCAVTPVN